MPYAVHARKLGDQTAAPEPAVDLALRKTGGQKLPSRRHPVRSRRQARYHLVHLPVLHTHTVR
jgi:hypothetical protein